MTANPMTPICCFDKFIIPLYIKIFRVSVPILPYFTRILVQFQYIGANLSKTNNLISAQKGAAARDARSVAPNYKPSFNVLHLKEEHLLAELFKLGPA